MDGEMWPVTQKLQPVETLVILDFEATGLPQDDPRITELCLIAVHRSELISSDGLPRVLNKLQLCLNPRKPIPAQVSKLTGLYNDHLEKMPPFSEDVVQLLEQFLELLPKPVCLLAHNGYGFDFPLLRGHLRRAGTDLNTGDLLCCDSLMTFRYLDGAEMLDRHLPYLEFKRGFDSDVSIQLECASSSVSENSNDNQTPGSSVSRAHANGPNDQIQMDENCNLSAVLLPNQNISNHANNENGVSEDQDVSPVRNIPLEEAFLVNNGSPDSHDDDEDMEADPLHFKFANETTPPNRPPIVNSAPRKSIPRRAVTQCDVGATKRQLNFEIPKTLPVVQTPRKSHERAAVDVGKTRRQLNFEMDVSGSENDKSFIIINQKRQSLDQEWPIRKKLRTSIDDHTSQIDTTGNSSSSNLFEALHVDIGSESVETFPPSSLEDDDLLCAVETTENNIEDIRNKIAGFKQTSDPCLIKPAFRLPGTASRPAMSNNSSQNSKPSMSFVPTPPKVSYSLSELYKRTFGEPPPNSHSAEDDCIALLRLIKQSSPKFMEWVDSFAIHFSHIESFP